MIHNYQELILNLNNSIVAPPSLVNLITGLLVAITILSMGAFNNLASSKFRWSKPLYYGACGFALIGIGINRFLSFPPTYPLSSALYLSAYLLFVSCVLYVGTTQRSYTNGRSANESIQID